MPCTAVALNSRIENQGRKSDRTRTVVQMTASVAMAAS